MEKDKKGSTYKKKTKAKSKQIKCFSIHIGCPLDIPFLTSLGQRNMRRSLKQCKR